MTPSELFMLLLPENTLITLLRIIMVLFKVLDEDLGLGGFEEGEEVFLCSLTPIYPMSNLVLRL